VYGSKHDSEIDQNESRAPTTCADEYADIATKPADKITKDVEGVLIEAAEQCERISVPEVLQAIKF
jgi:hypothetical protein